MLHSQHSTVARGCQQSSQQTALRLMQWYDSLCAHPFVAAELSLNGAAGAGAGAGGAADAGGAAGGDDAAGAGAADAAGVHSLVDC
eukprot:jgi/Chrzof1/10023/Cz04g24140.t1